MWGAQHAGEPAYAEVEDAICQLRQFPRSNHVVARDTTALAHEVCLDRKDNSLAARPFEIADRCAATFAYWGNPYERSKCDSWPELVHQPGGYLLPWAATMASSNLTSEHVDRFDDREVDRRRRGLEDLERLLLEPGVVAVRHLTSASESAEPVIPVVEQRRLVEGTEAGSGRKRRVGKDEVAPQQDVVGRDQSSGRSLRRLANLRFMRAQRRLVDERQLVQAGVPSSLSAAATWARIAMRW